ncbi:MAG: DUF4388 domain-containing protein [Candidatus Eisenbacteria bacterium]
MALQGNLEDFSLAEILQLIAIQRKSGVLRLTSDEANSVLFFEKGNVVCLNDRREKRNDPLMEFLASTARLTPDQVEQIHAIRMQSKKEISEIILTAGFLSNKQLTEAVEAHARELLPKLLTWKKGTYLFSGDEKTISRLFFKVPMRTEALLIESMRRIDESARIKELYSPSVVLRQKESPKGKELAEEEKWVLSLMDGKRPIREVLAKSRLGEFETYEVISDLIEAGLAEVAEWSSTQVEDVAPEPARTVRDLMPAFGTAFVVILMAVASFGLRWAALQIEGPPRVYRTTWASQARQEQTRFAVEVFRASHGAYPDELSQLVEEGLLEKREIEGLRYLKSGEIFVIEERRSEPR